MMTKLLKCLYPFLISLPVLIHANYKEIRKEHMLNDLDSIRNTFKVHYAPFEWKHQYANWDLETEIQAAKEKVVLADNPSVKDFQIILRDFFKSAKDYHTGVCFYSTEYAKLPFRVRGSEGKYYFTYIDRNRLSPEVFPFKVGDELVYFGDKRTDEVIQELKKEEMGASPSKTDSALAELSLTTRTGFKGQVVPKGPITITVCPKNSNSMQSYQLIWDYYPEKISNSFYQTKMSQRSHQKKAFGDNPLLKRNFTYPFYEKYMELAGSECANDTMGSRKSFIPELGKVCWISEAETKYHAYLFENKEGKLIGYVRIPDFLGTDFDVEDFRTIIEFFQEYSDALVVDQVNNPGGSMFHLYALISLLTDQPLYTPRHKMSITQEDVFTAVTESPMLENVRSDEEAQELFGSKTFEGIPVTYQMAQFLLNFYRFIAEEWNAGRTLTQPFYVYGVDKINPHPKTQYTKPILIITNELNFSCGDFFPAIMQDNKRATIFGAKTAGAGGYVLAGKFPNLNGVAFFNYTGSIAERADLNPIENLGVTPDIPYEISKDDLQFGYQDYADAINQAIKQIVK